MDNLTHSLVGLLAAEAVIRVRERKAEPALAPWTRAVIYVVSIVGNNLPDLDLSYSRISGKPFGYILQHRGYTHTVPAAMVFAALTMSVVFWLSKRREQPISRADGWLLAAVALASPLLHIAMDFANNYGVHPFWPVYDGWFYGDSFFILEPSFWLVIIAPLGFSQRSRAFRMVLWLVLAVALVALWYRPFVPRANAVALTVLSLLLLFAARTMSPRARLLLSAGCFALLAGSFVLGSRLAKATVSARARTAFPNAEELDIVATPTPANPFCWSVILVEREGAEYVVRLGKAATFPALLDVDACPADRDAQPTAPLVALDVRSENRLRLQAEYRVKTDELRTLARQRCEVRALLRFARVPYLTSLAADQTRIVGDVRYDRNPGLDFSDVRLPAIQGGCPPYVPPWLPPRGELLAPE